jgi:hypothetical protein
MQMLKNAGCVSILFGMETGSEKMLKVMEKKVKLQDNYDAMRLTIENGIYTVVQLVIGMPGESPSTIRETCDFAIYANTLEEWQKPWNVSVNYAQALPGTPLYEYALRIGLIDPTLEGEEAYLLKISDKNAADGDMTLNLTSYPYFIHRSYRELIMLKVLNAYIVKFGKEKYTKMLLSDTRYFKRNVSEETGYFNSPKKDIQKAVASDISDSINDVREIENINNSLLPSMFFLLKERKRTLLFLCYPEICVKFVKLLPFFWLLKSIRSNGLKETLVSVFSFIRKKVTKGDEGPDHSLRKVVFDEMPPLPNNVAAMEPLRRGR